MAEVTAFRNNALPYPVYGVPWAVVFPMLDADGDLVTGATTPDAEVSKNGDTFADCTNESTEIATNSGVYYLLLTGAEMTADIVSVIAKSATAGMKTTVLTFYPRKLVSLRAGTSQGGAAGSITLDASAGARDDRYNGCLCVATIDTLVEARIITDYTGSTQAASVTPNWNVTPDADDTFVIYLPEGMQLPTVNVGHIAETAQTGRDLGTSVLLSSGTGTGQLDFTGGIVKSNLSQILGTALTETAGLLAGGFKKFFNVATPTGTLNSLADAVPGTAGGGFIAGTNAATSITTALTANVIGNITGNLSGSIGSYTGNTPQTGDSFARLGAPAGVSVSADIAAIEAQTDDIGIAGAGLTAIVLAKGTGITGFNDLSAADVRTAVGLASANLDTQLDALPTAAENADANWDELMSGHLGVGSTGEALNAAGAAGDPWTTALPGAYGAGSAGFIIGNNLDASVADVEADTQNIQTRVPAALVSGRMDSNMQAAANGVITALVIATDAIDSDAIAANAITEIQNGLATAAALAAVSGFVDTEIATLQADVSAILDDTGITGVVVAAASKTGYALGAAGVDEIFDELRAGHSVAGSYGESFFTMESGAAIAGTLSTTQMSTNLTEATDDHYNGRILIFTSGALLRQATDITAYNGTTKVPTFTALTEAPTAGDKFIIV